MTTSVALRTWRHFCPPKAEDVHLERGWPCAACGDTERLPVFPSPDLPPPEAQMDHDRRQEARRVDDLTVAMMKRDIDELRALNTRLLAEIEALKSDRDKALRWGVVTLGVAVIGMATWIFNMLFSGKVGH